MVIIVGHGKRAVDEFPSRGHYEVREGVCEGCEEGQGPVPGKVPGTFPITPATSDTWPALRPPGVFEFTTANNWPQANSGQGPATGFKHPT